MTALKAAWAFLTGGIGRWLALAGLALGLAAYLVGVGRRQERDRQVRQTLEDLRTRQDLEEELAPMTDDELDERGRPWLRP